MKLVNPDADSAQVQFPPPLLYLGALLLALALDWVLPFPTRADGLGVASELRWWLAALLGVPAIVVMAAGAGLFRRLGTNVKPWQTSTRLVTSGIFAWTRNPMYLGMTLLFAALAIGFDSWVALLFLPAVLIVIRKQVIAKEERYLERKFGNEYRAYKKRVRRWL